MKISLEWLKDYIDIDGFTPEQLADIMSGLGFPAEEIVSLDDGDTVIDFEITSNRGDCLSYIGIARELSVATGRELVLPEVDYDQLPQQTSDFVDVNICQPQLCNRYTARYIEGVKVGSSPDWMVRRLEASGVRSVNNVVDATNYAMLETGQPPHAFDYDKLGKKIVVRNAKNGEKIVSIDHSVCELKDNMLVIADGEKPVAIAGVMGGAETEVSEQTTKILLEEASFDPVTVRTAARGLVLNSEASFRFERYVDTEMIDWASKRTAKLITAVAGGKVAGGIVDEYPVKSQKPQVEMRLSRLEKVLGFGISTDFLLSAFEKLGFDPTIDEANGKIVCQCPTWRTDISREVDLIEEAVRTFGYDNIPVNTKISIEVTKPDVRSECMRGCGNFLNACGYYETLGITFTDEQTTKIFTNKTADEHLKVLEDIRKSNNLLRQTLIGTLAASLKSNRNVGNYGCKFFEIADTFEIENAKLNEKTKIALICEEDLRSLRSVLEALIKRFDKFSVVELEQTELPWAQTGAKVLLNGKQIGVCGKFSKDACKQMGLKDIQPCAIEIEFDPILEISGKEFKITHLPKFPSIVRDISIVIDENVLWKDIEQNIGNQAPATLEKVEFVDLYRGKQIPAGKKSITLAMTFRDDDGTLTHEQVDTYEKPIIDSLKKDFAAELRTA